MSKKNKQSAILRKMSKKHYTAFGAAILAIGILHFFMQMSIIQGEHRRIVETNIKTYPTVEPMPVVKAPELVIETESAKSEIGKSDRIDVPKTVVVQKDLIPQKINHTDVVPDIARSEPERRVKNEKVEVKRTERKNFGKKKSVSAPSAERFRRAEQILTGF